ncbi:MAG: hypothetical protein GWP08_16095, partial [Nitrospiraceae bacterium]|nr:hypothetical protein [Nitrospiraceae bacterium]
MAGPVPQKLFERMALIRVLEETLLRLFAEGKLSGTTHTSIGQEAIAVSVGAHLAEDDVVFASHRCHGHYIAYGGPPELLLAEVMGRDTGVCGGRGGSQHLHYRRFFSSGVQGGIVGNAVGAALALKEAGEDAIAVVFLGDGTLGEGLVYESLNFAALRHLPILFVLEDNRYAQSTPVDLAISGSMSARAEAFGIESGEIESNDVLELYDVFAKRFAQVREQRAPFFQVVHTYRLAPHSKGDDHRDPREIEERWAQDPLALLRSRLDETEAQALEAQAEACIVEAVAVAEAAPVASMVPAIAAPPDVDTPTPFPADSDTFAQSLNRALHALLDADDRAFLIGEDVLDPYGGAFAVAKGLSTCFPRQVITSPISEAGMVAWATGAALLGAHPVVEIMFGDFLALAADQVLNHATKYGWVCGGDTAIPLVLRAPMGGGRGYGPSHSQSIEKMFMGMPGLTAVAPPHLLDPGTLLRRSVEVGGPVLFMEHKRLYGRALETVTGGRAGHFYVRATSSRFPTLHLSLVEFD